MRRRPMQLFVAIVGVSLLAVAVPASAAADTTPPVVSYTIDGIAGTNNWYRGSTHGNYVVVHWSVTDPDSSITATSGCDPAVRINGPDKGTTTTCTATSDGGTTTITTKPIKIDADPPTAVAASPSRAPDHSGWYNHAVGVFWHGSDATSGIASCSSVNYAGPDGASKSVAGGCTDLAGNSASAPVSLNYDATAPVLSKVSVTSAATADVVHWTSSSPSDSIVVQRSARGNKAQPVVFRGSGTQFRDKKVQSGIEYAYAIQSTDEAGNVSKKVTVMGLPKVLTLRKTPYVPRAARKPILHWQRVRGATYYNVQLFRGSKRILALWPTGNQLGLPLSWRWAGHRYRLSAGRYRWYVWAGIGRRAFARYKAVGSAQFIVPR